MQDLFLGTGIAHSIMLFAFVIAIGLYLGRFKVKGISIGSTWILFIGILISHLGFRANPTVLSFMKDFGLILFVFSIGLQVGPGFFQSFKKGGVVMNLLAILLVSLAVGVTCLVSFVSGEDLQTMTGVMSGAVTNTPGLGAAQQTLMDATVASGGTAEAAAKASAGLASAYAVSYPLGVLGLILLIIICKAVFKVDLKKEQAALEADEDAGEMARRMHCMITNPAIIGKTVRQIGPDIKDKCVISRMMKGNKIIVPGPKTVLEEGDKVLLVTNQSNVDSLRIVFGEEVPMHVAEWEKMEDKIVSRRLAITKSSLTGTKLKNLNIREDYGVTVTRVVRSGIELVAHPGLILQMGDSIQVVGPETNIGDVAKVVGNKPETLTHPNLVPIFLGIVVGIIIGSIPIRFPGIPQPVKLGLAGGPLIVSIFLGYFGPRWKITTYTTLSANMMVREIGISFFMAAVGLGAGENFVSSIVNGGYWWILYGAIITMVPVAIVMVVARLVFKLNFYQICGLVTGGMTDPPALAFAQNAYGTDYTSVNYATVYPLTMFMRVLAAQLLILFSF